MAEAVLSLEAPAPAATASQRTRAVATGSAALAVSRAWSLAMGLLVTGLAARYLSAETFGLWAVLTALPGFFTNLDLGMGNALRNRLASLAAFPSRELEARAMFASTVRFCAFGAAAFSLIFAASLWGLPAGAWLGAADAGTARLWTACVFVAVAALALQIALGMGSFGFFAYQETHLYAFFEGLRSTLTAAAVAAAVGLGAGLLGLVGGYFGSILAAGAAGLLFFLRRRGWSLGGSPRLSVKQTVESLVRPGLLFAVMQVGSGIFVLAGSLAAGRALGLAAAGEFAVAQKLFLVLITAQFLVLTPLWSAYTDAWARNDRAWVRAALSRSVGLTAALFGLGALALTALGPALVLWWTGKSVPDRALYASLGVWALAYGASSCLSVFLNAIGRLRRQALISASAAALNVPLGIVLGRAYGLPGVCWAGVLLIVPAIVNNALETRAALREAAR